MFGRNKLVDKKSSVGIGPAERYKFPYESICLSISSSQKISELVLANAYGSGEHRQTRFKTVAELGG
nr:hypothetical protein CFP56_45267 [Quercus suber]